MRTSRFLFIVVALLAVATSLAAQVPDSREGATAPRPAPAVCGGAGSPTSSQRSTHGLDLTDFDRSVRPCDDFYQFANGGWFKRNPIPAAYPAWGLAQKLAQSNQ